MTKECVSKNQDNSFAVSFDLLPTVSTSEKINTKLQGVDEKTRMTYTDPIELKEVVET